MAAAMTAPVFSSRGYLVFTTEACVCVCEWAGRAEEKEDLSNNGYKVN